MRTCVGFAPVLVLILPVVIAFQLALGEGASTLTLTTITATVLHWLGHQCPLRAEIVLILIKIKAHLGTESQLNRTVYLRAQAVPDGHRTGFACKREPPVASLSPGRSGVDDSTVACLFFSFFNYFMFY